MRYINIYIMSADKTTRNVVKELEKVLSPKSILTGNVYFLESPYINEIDKNSYINIFFLIAGSNLNEVENVIKRVRMLNGDVRVPIGVIILSPNYPKDEFDLKLSGEISKFSTIIPLNHGVNELKPKLSKNASESMIFERLTGFLRLYISFFGSFLSDKYSYYMALRRGTVGIFNDIKLDGEELESDLNSIANDLKRKFLNEYRDVEHVLFGIFPNFNLDEKIKYTDLIEMLEAILNKIGCDDFSWVYVPVPDGDPILRMEMVIFQKFENFKKQQHFT